MTTDLSIALRHAHDLIAERGIARYRYYDEDTGALDIEGSLHFTLPYRAEREAARVFIRTALRELHPETRTLRENFDLSPWCDEHTQSQVLAVLLHAAVLAERSPDENPA